MNPFPQLRRRPQSSHHRTRGLPARALVLALALAAGLSAQTTPAVTGGLALPFFSSAGVLWTPAGVFRYLDTSAAVNEIKIGGASIAAAQGVVFNATGSLACAWTPTRVLKYVPALNTVTEVTYGGSSIAGVRGIVASPASGDFAIWTAARVFAHDTTLNTTTEMTFGGSSIPGIEGVVFNSPASVAMAWTPTRVFKYSATLNTVTEIKAGGASIAGTRNVVFNNPGSVALLWTPTRALKHVVSLNTTTEITFGSASLSALRGVACDPGANTALLWTPTRVLLHDLTLQTTQELKAAGASIPGTRGAMWGPFGGNGVLWTAARIYRYGGLPLPSVTEITAGAASIAAVRGIVYRTTGAADILFWTPTRVFRSTASTATELSAGAGSISGTDGILSNGNWSLLLTPGRVYRYGPVASPSLSEVTAGGASIVTYSPAQVDRVQVVLQHQSKVSGAGLVGRPVLTPVAYAGSRSAAVTVPATTPAAPHGTVLGATGRMADPLILGPEPVAGVVSGNAMRVLAFPTPIAVEGDLVLTLRAASGAATGLTVALNPTTGAWSTLASSAAGFAPAGLRMARDNDTLLVTLVDAPPQNGALVRLSAGGVGFTLAALPGGAPRGLGLDFDDQLIVAGGPRRLWALDLGTSQLSTLFSLPGVELFQDLAIDRDPGAPPYVIALSRPTTLAGPILLGTDRQGVVTTIVGGASAPPGGFGGVALDPGSGDYLALTFPPLLSSRVLRVTKGGGWTSLRWVPRAGGLRLAQDGAAWIAGDRPIPQANPRPTVYRMTPSGTVTTILTAPPALDGLQPTGVEIYGSRRLVVRGSGAPGTSMAVRLHSRKPGDGGRPYLLACSFARRPGIVWPGGERLDLAPDPLFFISAFGLAPGVFVGFQGTTSAAGTADAQVLLPSGLPPNLGLPLFVGGVILGPGGTVRTVTNTQAFVLP